VASARIEPVRTPSGERRFKVRYSLGGRLARKRYGGRFKTKREATIRKQWIDGELAALRVSDLDTLGEPLLSPTLREATKAWRDSRIDVSQGTRTNDRVNTERVFEHDAKLAAGRIDTLDAERWTRVFAELAEPYERGTLKKSKEAFAVVYDHLAIDPNPLRDPRVKLPHARPTDMVVPIAAHVEAVARALPAKHVLPYLTIDWTGLRLGTIEGARQGELDEHRQALLARASIAKNEADVGRPARRAVRDDRRAATRPRGPRPRRAVVP
jgi:hypothetical protein